MIDEDQDIELRQAIRDLITRIIAQGTALLANAGLSDRELRQANTDIATAFNAELRRALRPDQLRHVAWFTMQLALMLIEGDEKPKDEPQQAS